MKALTSIAEQYDIYAIYAFGSRASKDMALAGGKTNEIKQMQSDVDIGVLIPPEAMLSVQRKVQLSVDMEWLVSVPRMDLVVINEEGPSLALDIITGELIFCSKLDAQAKYEIYVMR
ncbi:MAG: nucleotidyltransferase domain-containing protein, partial [Candidatus Bathyarchaeota archaeon]